MDLKYLKLANVEHHEYFVQTVYDILSELKFGYTYDEIEKMSIESGYSLYFHNKKTKRWHLGIWAVGQWNIKEEINNKVIAAGYGVDAYKPLTISVFLIHDWTYDKFRPTYSDWETLIEYGDNIDNVKRDLKYTFKHPIGSYYNIIDEDNYNFQHRESNKYVAYFKGWYYNEFLEFMREKHRRWFGYIASKLIMLITFFDRRVAYRKHKFHKDRWNSEYEIAVVFKYGETEWDDWKRWYDYNKLWQRLRKLSNYNIYMNFTYLDEEGNMPKNIWRGIYWENEPENN